MTEDQTELEIALKELELCVQRGNRLAHASLTRMREIETDTGALD